MKQVNHVLITGAAGFLGSAIVRHAIASGLSVTATDRLKEITVAGGAYISADILDQTSLPKLFNGIDCVCHVAGLAHVFNIFKAKKAPFNAVNVTGTKNMLQAALQAGVRNFIYISSVSVYGDESYGNDESAKCCPSGPYAMSKWQAEQSIVEFGKKTGMNITILRLTALYGEGDPGNVARLIHKLDNGRFLWIGNGRNRKSLLHRDDAARACMAVIMQPPSGVNIFNVSAPACTMKEIVDHIEKKLGKKASSIHIPASLILNITGFMARMFNNHFSNFHKIIRKWLAEDVYDTRRFEETFGFQVTTGLEDGLKLEIDWYRKNSGLER